ncbi:hypothetical protein TIFTF001_012507 [Ficus carica]|uniref:Uncharacterized protein n=1 Tax=Ficus carica TaxID=3494 RepID=A0AA88AG29_FICCA|nr:hypothetical protein TIFTF001_012507 [Ficus carica]
MENLVEIQSKDNSVHLPDSKARNYLSQPPPPPKQRGQILLRSNFPPLGTVVEEQHCHQSKFTIRVSYTFLDMATEFVMELLKSLALLLKYILSEPLQRNLQTNASGPFLSLPPRPLHSSSASASSPPFLPQDARRGCL